MKLRGRTALVTGAARRIGRAIARRLAESGCNLAIHYGKSAAEAAETTQLCRDAGVRAQSYAADLADTATARWLVERVTADFSRLDVIINNASVFERMTLESFDVTDWERALRINLTAPLALAHAAASELRRRGGRIVNLCDAATSRPWPDHLAYMVSKGALETLTRALARGLAPEVNVVGVSPGVAEWPPDYDEATRARLTARIPLNRAGSPEDVAAAVHFLLAEGDYVTGTILAVDGGRQVV
jgi:NAD(P)-dependent dehydrogenase (short-subunit alcohol dehydrogenase family)